MCRKLYIDMDSEARSAEMENYTEELRAIKLWGTKGTPRSCGMLALVEVGLFRVSAA